MEQTKITKLIDFNVTITFCNIESFFEELPIGITITPPFSLKTKSFGISLAPAVAILHRMVLFHPSLKAITINYFG